LLSPGAITFPSRITLPLSQRYSALPNVINNLLVRVICLVIVHPPFLYIFITRCPALLGRRLHRIMLRSRPRPADSRRSQLWWIFQPWLFRYRCRYRCKGCRGGGGRGYRVVHESNQTSQLFQRTRLHTYIHPVRHKTETTDCYVSLREKLKSRKC